METYKNLSGTSGVSRYETGADYIIVEFGKGNTYLYNYASAGKEKIEQMKELARKGRGLSTYISRYVKEDYSRKVS
jgi:hypothetical protein